MGRTAIWTIVVAMTAVAQPGSGRRARAGRQRTFHVVRGAPVRIRALHHRHHHRSRRGSDGFQRQLHAVHEPAQRRSDPIRLAAHRVRRVRCTRLQRRRRAGHRPLAPMTAIRSPGSWSRRAPVTPRAWDFRASGFGCGSGSRMRSCRPTPTAPRGHHREGVRAHRGGPLRDCRRAAGGAAPRADVRPRPRRQHVGPAASAPTASTNDFGVYAGLAHRP